MNDSNSYNQEQLNRLYVGSLAWAVTEEQLKNFFASAGEVTSAIIIKDKRTGRSSGYGFVEMKSAEDAQKAVAQLNGKDLEGRAIVVNIARPRKQFSTQADTQ